MRHISRKFSKVEYVIAAASDTPGTVEINVHKNLDGSSTLKETSGTHVDGVPRQVPTVKIDDLCRVKQLKGPYLIKVDVQGAELTVLGGAQEVLKETDLVILEVSLFQFFTNGPQFFDVVSYMKERNFVVYDIFGGHLRPLDGALAQVDIAFAKEDGLFKKSHAYGAISNK
jgi:FkbM family methyltransferase